MTMKLELVTAPSVEAVTLAELKEHLRELGTDFDANILPLYLTTAIEYVQGRADARLQLNNTTYDERHSGWFSSGVPYRLQVYPVGSITSVKYWDTDAAEQTLASSEYLLTAPTYTTGTLELDPDASTLPNLHARDYPVTIRYVAGFGALAANVPETIKSAVKLAAQGIFEGRMSELKAPIDDLLGPYCAGAYS